jgi:hypothetical protein
MASAKSANHDRQKGLGWGFGLEQSEPRHRQKNVYPQGSPEKRKRLGALTY